jgi:putative transposase
MSHPESPRKSYNTDMTDGEWEVYRQIFPELIGIPGVSEPKTTTRELLNAIRYQTRTGCQWRNLPHDFPPWSTIKSHYYGWIKKGLFQQYRELVSSLERCRQGRTHEPTACAVDSQSSKATEMGGEKGFDAGKKIKGRKRHLVVDVFGLVLAILLTAASVQDRDGGSTVLAMAKAKYPTLQLAWTDSAYNGSFLETCTQLGMRNETRERPEGVTGFHPIKHRWVVERTFGWLNWWRRLAKEFDRSTDSAQARIDIALGAIVTRRLDGQMVRFRL